MNLERYCRHTVYKNLSETKQETLLNSEVTLVGVGALGSVCANLLARFGLGTINLIDFDTIELINLQRQILYDESDVDKLKAEVAKEKLLASNSEIKVNVSTDRLTLDNASELLKGNLIFDCSDNIETRLIVNKYCYENNIPLVHLAALEDTGVITFFENKIGNDEPCLNCIYNESMPSRKCSKFGVLNTITNTVSSIAINEGIKFLTGEMPTKDMIRFNIWNYQYNLINLKKNPKCPICSK